MDYILNKRLKLTHGKSDNNELVSVIPRRFLVLLKSNLFLKIQTRWTCLNTYQFDSVIKRIRCKINLHKFFLKKDEPTPASLSFIFGLFNINTIFIINVKNVQMSIQYTAPRFEPTTTWHMSQHPQPLDQGSRPIYKSCYWINYNQVNWKELNQLK